LRTARGGDHDRQQEAIAEPDREHADDAERQAAEADLGLEAAVAAREADFPGDAGPVEEVKAGADDAGDPDRDGRASPAISVLGETLEVSV
jgi:hypothetical protein